jgi:hypothetical protein
MKLIALLLQLQVLRTSWRWSPLARWLANTILLMLAMLLRIIATIQDTLLNFRVKYCGCLM